MGNTLCLVEYRSAGGQNEEWKVKSGQLESSGFKIWIKRIHAFGEWESNEGKGDYKTKAVMVSNPSTFLSFTLICIYLRWFPFFVPESRAFCAPDVVLRKMRPVGVGEEGKLGVCARGR